MSKYTLIVKYLKGFENMLDNNHELCLEFPDYGGPFLLQSTMSGGDEFIAFELLQNEREKFTVIQNYSQLNFAIISCPKPVADKPVRRVGFISEFS